MWMHRIIAALLVIIGIGAGYLVCTATVANRYVNGSGAVYVGLYGTYAIGSDSTGNGTLASPWATMAKAEHTASPGDTVYVAAGTYTEYDATPNRCAGYTVPCGASGFDKELAWRADGPVIIGTGVTSSVYGKVNILPNSGSAPPAFTEFTFDGSRSGMSDAVNVLRLEAGANVAMYHCVLKYAQDGSDIIDMASNSEANFEACTYSGRGDSTDAGWVNFRGKRFSDIGGTVICAGDVNNYGFYGNDVAGTATGSIDFVGTTFSPTAAETGLNDLVHVEGGNWAINMDVIMNLPAVSTPSGIKLIGQTEFDVRGSFTNLINATNMYGIQVVPQTGRALISGKLHHCVIDFPAVQSGYGISVGTEETSSTDNLLNGIEISDNSITGYQAGTTSWHAIHIGFLSSYKCTRNYVTGGRYGIVSEHTTGNPWLSGGIWANVLRNCDFGILFKGQSDVPWVGNTIYSDVAAGLSAVWFVNQTGGAPSTGTIGKNNVIAMYNQDPGDTVYAFADAANMSGHVFDHNLIYTTGSGNIATGHATWPSWIGTGQDLHSINSDPKFRDSANGDFHILASSPAFNAGVALSPDYALDFDGKDQRRYGKGWEMGAYTFQEASSFGTGF